MLLILSVRGVLISYTLLLNLWDSCCTVCALDFIHFLPAIPTEPIHQIVFPGSGLSKINRWLAYGGHSLLLSVNIFDLVTYSLKRVQTDADNIVPKPACGPESQSLARPESIIFDSTSLCKQILPSSRLNMSYKPAICSMSLGVSSSFPLNNSH